MPGPNEASLYGLRIRADMCVFTLVGGTDGWVNGISLNVGTGDMTIAEQAVPNRYANGLPFFGPAVCVDSVNPPNHYSQGFGFFNSSLCIEIIP